MAKKESKSETSTSYTKRIDGRKFDELRPMEARAGTVKRADGSSFFVQGNTSAYCGVYGPRDLYPKFLQNPKKGILRCHYNMLPFSATERVRPGGSRRSKEISMVTEKALRPVLNLDDYPNAVVDVFIELPQTDAGSRCVGINAASIALADAGIPMKDLVAAVAVGKVGDKIVADLNYQEEAFEGGATDIPVAMIQRTGEITLLQMDGEITKEELIKALKLAKEKVKDVFAKQRDALKKKYRTSEGAEK